MDTRPGLSHFGEAFQEAETAQAERVVAAEHKRIGWSEADLKTWRKGEPRKVELAWIAERLNLGIRGHLAWLLQQHGRKRPT